MPSDKLLLGYELLQLHQYCQDNGLRLTMQFGDTAWVCRKGENDILLTFHMAGQAPHPEHFRRIYRALVEKLAQEPL